MTDSIVMATWGLVAATAVLALVTILQYLTVRRQVAYIDPGLPEPGANCRGLIGGELQG